MRLVLTWMVGIAVLPMLAEAGWLMDVVGTHPDGLMLVDVGDGRNDGLQRVYTSSLNGHLLEWSYEGGSWVLTNCGGNSHDKMMGLCIGDGRNDGVNRVYAAHSSGLIYEFTYTAGRWVMDTVDATIGYGMGVCIGAGRDDDTNRVFGAGWPNQREYTWESAGWRQLDLSNDGHTARKFVIADGRNDGGQRVYGAYHDSCVREYTWQSGAYVEELLSVSTQAMNVAAGPTRGDGITRIYVAGRFGHIYEYTYESGAWRRIDIMPGAPDLARYGLYIGCARRDGKPRLYSAAAGGGAFEHSWIGNAWSDSTIDAVSGASGDITVGVGRNDGIPRVYVNGCLNGILFEFTNTEFVLIKSRTDRPPSRLFVVHAAPNPFATKVAITYLVPRRTDVRVAVYDAGGAEACRLVDEPQDAGLHTVRFGGHNARGVPLAPGVYFCRVQCGPFYKTVKVVKLD